MSQNIPPGPNNPYGAPTGDADHSTNNPYFAQRQEQAPEPNLDAGAPVLRSADGQRMNRKALLFLGGILLILMAMIWLVVRNASQKDEAPKPVREEQVEVPDLQVPTAPVAPVEVVQTPAQEPLPPLPVVEDVPVTPETASAVPVEQGPSLLERRIAAANSGGSEGSGGPGVDPVAQAVAASLQASGLGPQKPVEAPEPPASAALLNNPDALLVRGTYIRCILETRIITDVPGFTSCVVTEPIYSINGRRLLLPRGSKVSGSYEGEPNGPRVAVTWDRITTPNGIDVRMESPGVDGLGSAGHPGRYTAHWASRITSALLISLISDGFKYAAAEEGPRTSVVTPGGTVIDQPFESNTARAMERLANQALEKSANRPATVTINQGTMVNIYVAKDVDFTGVLAR